MSSKTSQNEIKNFVVFILLAIIAYFIFFYDDNGGNDKTLYRKNPATQINDLNRQSVKKDDQNLSKPGIGRTIKGLDGLDINKDF